MGIFKLVKKKGLRCRLEESCNIQNYRVLKAFNYNKNFPDFVDF